MPPRTSESVEACGEQGGIGLALDLVLSVFPPAEGGGDQRLDHAQDLERSYSGCHIILDDAIGPGGTQSRGIGFRGAKSGSIRDRRRSAFSFSVDSACTTGFKRDQSPSGFACPGVFPSASEKIAGCLSPRATHMTTPMMIGTNHGSPIRRCVQTAPPR